MVSSIVAQAGGNDGHGVDLLGVASPGEVVDRGVQALQDRAVGREAAEALRDLIADIAGFDAREDEGCLLYTSRAPRATRRS